MILRAGLLAGVALGALAAVSCAPSPNVNNTGYVICDDTDNANACPNSTSPVIVNYQA